MTTEEITKLNNLISMVAMCITDTASSDWEVDDYLRYTLACDNLPTEVVEHIVTVVLDSRPIVTSLLDYYLEHKGE